MKYTFILFVCLLCQSAFSQNGSIGIGTETPNENAVLDLVSPGGNQGLLIPKLTTEQRTATTFTDNLDTDESGLVVFDTDDSTFYYWSVDQWAALGLAPNLSFDNQTFELTVTDGNTVSLGNISESLDADSTNELQTISYQNDTLTLSDNGGSVGFSKQDLDLTGNTISITGITNPTQISVGSFSGANTDEQTLSYDEPNDSLSISGGNTISVGSYVNNWDLQVSDSLLANDLGATRIGKSFISTTPDSIISVTGVNQRIDGDLVTSRVLFLRSDVPVQQEASVLRIDAAEDGQELIIIGRSDNFDQVRLIASTTSQTGSGLMLLDGDMFLRFADKIRLVYSADMGYWIEVDRSFYSFE